MPPTLCTGANWEVCQQHDGGFSGDGGTFLCHLQSQISGLIWLDPGKFLVIGGLWLGSTGQGNFILQRTQRREASLIHISPSPLYNCYTVTLILPPRLQSRFARKTAREIAAPKSQNHYHFKDQGDLVSILIIYTPWNRHDRPAGPNYEPA